jgi:flagellar hook-associated protein 2
MGARIGSVTFGGLSSGLPTDEIVSQLLELSRRPIDALERRKGGFDEKLEVLRDLNAKTLALRDALRRLDNMADVVRQADQAPLPSAFEEFRRYAASSSDETRLRASAGAGASPGSLSIQIDQLARQHRERSDDGFESAQSVFSATGGTLSIEVGVASPTTTDVAIAAGATLEEVAAAINAAAGLAVTAFIVNDGRGAVDSLRLFITSDATGVEQTLDVTTSFGRSFTATQTAQDASIALDPGPLQTVITSPDNSFGDVVQGLSLQVLATTPLDQPVTVTVQTSTEAVLESLEELVGAYNAVADVVRQQSQVDPQTHRGGPLIGDPALVGLSQRLAGALARTYGSGELSHGSQIGLQLDRSGKLTLDREKLSDALEGDFEAVARFASGPGSLTDALREVVDSFVDPVSGALVARIQGTSESIADLDRSIADAEERLDELEAELVRQFAALERSVAEFQRQGNFLAGYLLASNQR